MRIKQVIGLVILFIAFSIPSPGQVLATWTDSSGNWSNSANWSTLTVPNNGGGKTYDVEINGTGADTVTFDASSTTINGLTLGPGETLQTNGSSPTLTAGFVSNTNGTINWDNGSLTIEGLSNTFGGVANIHNTGVSMGVFDPAAGGLLMLTGCIGSIGGVNGGGGGSALFIDHSNLTVGSSSFADAATVSITSSTVILGDVFNGDRTTMSIAGSSVITGGIENGFGAFLTIDGSSVIAGSLGNGTFNGGIGIGNGSAVTANVVGNNAQFGVDGTSSLTVSGDFSNGSFDGIPAIAAISGAFIVTGTLTNIGGSLFFTDGTIHAVQNDAIMRAGGVLIVNGGGFSNQMNGSLTLSGVTNVAGGFTNSGGSVVVNPSAILTSDSYSQGGGSTDVSGTLSTASYKQSGGGTIIESGGTISATTFKATGGAVTVNGTLDPTAVEIAPGRLSKVQAKSLAM